jgi:hypothetical protein
VAGSAYVIDYDATFVFPVSVTKLWATMTRVDCYQSLWSWLDEFCADGADLEPGTVLHGVVVPPLPYRMRLDVVVEDCIPERSITALVHGDLEGAAQLTFDGDDAETRAHATWTIEMMQRPMRMAARIAPRVLRWGHDRVVEATVDGFRRRVVEEGRR